MSEDSRSASSSPSFGLVLRECRLATGLTQAALAERAGLAARTIQDLERGIALPRRETIRRLVDALAPPPELRTRLESATPAPRTSVRRSAQDSSVDTAVAANGSEQRRSGVRPLDIGAQRLLPSPLTSFVGREQDVAALSTMWTTTRLLTLTGVGGVGKTRLALEMAHSVQNRHPDGVWFVELAALMDANLVAPAVSEALRIVEQPGQPTLETIIKALQGRQLLLLLDNCEHLVDACANLAARLLAESDGIKILATSREPLGVPGELVWRVPPLAVPELKSGTSLDARALSADQGAARLFVERARLVQPTFTLSDLTVPTVVKICDRLDGIPLAIELAAAWMSTLTTDQIAERLDDQLQLLTRGSRTAEPRQRTLSAALDWSYNLLGEPERLLLCRLAVFAGGWTLDAAESVCADREIQRANVLDLLARLIDTSLVTVEQREHEARYRLLEPVRQYVWRRLRASGDEAPTRDRHAAWCLTLVEQADPALRTADEALWRSRLDAERDNLRTALGWSLERDQEAGLRLAGLMSWYWWVRSAYEEGGYWLEAFLARVPGSTADRAVALRGLSRVIRVEGSREGSRPRLAALNESLAIYRSLGDIHGQAKLLRDVGNILCSVGEVDEGRAHLEEGLALIRQVGDRRGIAGNLAWLGARALDEGLLGHAQERLEESLRINREVGDPWLLIHVLMYLGSVATFRGDFSAAHARFAEAITATQQQETPTQTAILNWRMAHLAYCEGNLVRATALYEASLTVARDRGDHLSTIAVLHGRGLLALERGDLDTAQSCFEEALGLLASIDTVRRGAMIYGLGLVACRQGHRARAAGLLRESLDLRAKARQRVGIAACLEALAEVAAAMQEAARSARLLGAAESLRQNLGAPLSPVESPGVERVAQWARSALGSDAYERSHAEGQAMAMEQAIAYALGTVPSPAADVT